MAPKKVRIPKDGFTLFVEELATSRGKAPAEVFESAGPLWEKLPWESKQIYNNKAIDNGEDLTRKYTSQGIPISTISNLQMERQEKETIMLCHIKSLIGKLNIKTTFLTQPFFLCHVNFFYADSDGIFKPAEIGISEFNLNEGVMRTFHRFIDPGQCALGYRYQVKEWAERTHNIPFQHSDWTLGEKDYALLYMELKYFLMGDNENEVVLFTMPNSLNQNNSTSAIVSTFKTLQEHAGAEDDVIKVYSLPVLYYEMLKKLLVASGEDPSRWCIPSACAQLEKDLFSCSRHLACPFHEEKDLSIHCSLSVVKRWAFYICDMCLSYTKIQMIPGKHCPIDSKVVSSNQQIPDEGGFYEVKKKHHSKGREKYSVAVEPRAKTKEQKLRDSKPITITFGETGKTEVYSPLDFKSPPINSSGGCYARVLKGAAPPPQASTSNFPSLNKGGGNQEDINIPKYQKVQQALNPSAPPWLPKSSPAWPVLNKRK